jgi:hypothetical protein
LAAGLAIGAMDASGGFDYLESMLDSWSGSEGTITRPIPELMDPPSPGQGRFGWKGTVGPSGLAGRCDQFARSYMNQYGGTDRHSAPGLEPHHWVENSNGTMYDPTLRDNLASWDVQFSDIPRGQEIFSPLQHAQYIARIPRMRVP